MLFLFNKAKIISYTISIFTVVALFCVANSFYINGESVQVATNIINSDSNIDN